MTDEQRKAFDAALYLYDGFADKEHSLFLAGWTAGATARQRMDVELCQERAKKHSYLVATAGEIASYYALESEAAAQAIESTPMPTEGKCRTR